MDEQQVSPRRIQVRMLIGLGEDDTLPLAAGCIDTGLWDVSPPEETDAQFAAMKRPLEGSGYGYEWREVTVTLNAEELLKHFSGPVLDGAISTPAS
jgi:hypothetical protein